MKKIILGGVLLLFLILNFVFIPDYYRAATKINVQAVQIDTFTYFQINEEGNKNKGYYPMERVDLVQSQKDVWQAYDYITSGLLWTRNTIDKELIVVSSTCLLELGERVIVDSLPPQSILSRVNLETGALLWEKNLSALQRDWDPIEPTDIEVAEYSEQSEEEVKIKIVKGKSTILVAFYQNYRFTDMLRGEYIIDVRTGRIMRLNKSAGVYRRNIKTIPFKEIINEFERDWSSIDYYPEEELFFDTRSRSFFKIPKRQILMSGDIYTFVTPTHYIFIESKLLYSEKNIHVISKVRPDPKWQAVTYDASDEIQVGLNHITLYNDNMYSIYNMNNLEDLEIVEQKDRKYIDERFWLEMEEDKVKWIIEESNYSIHVNQVNTEQIKELRMNIWKGERFFRKQGDWMYIYEQEKEVEGKYQTKQLYKYKVPLHFESQ